MVPWIVAPSHLLRCWESSIWIMEAFMSACLNSFAQGELYVIQWKVQHLMSQLLRNSLSIDFSLTCLAWPPPGPEQSPWGSWPVWWTHKGLITCCLVLSCVVDMQRCCSWGGVILAKGHLLQNLQRWIHIFIYLGPHLHEEVHNARDLVLLKEEVMLDWPGRRTAILYEKTLKTALKITWYTWPPSVLLGLQILQVLLLFTRCGCHLHAPAIGAHPVTIV